MRTIRSLLLVFLAFALSSAFALTTKHDQFVAMDAILAELKIHYGMDQHKERFFGVTLDSLRAKYGTLIDKAMTLEESLGWDAKVEREILPEEEFRQLMIGLIAELRDGHVNIARQSNELTTLGLNTVNVGEKLIVTGIVKELMVTGASMDQIKVNDEILEVDGIPVLEHAKRNLLYATGGTFEDRFQTAMLLIATNFHGYQRAKREGDRAVLKIKRGEKVFTAHLRWVNRSEFTLLKARFPKNFATAMDKAYKMDAPVPYGARGTVRTYFKTGLLKTDDAAGLINVGELLNREIAKTAEAVKENDTDSINAALKELSQITRLELYMVRHQGKNVGVLRIPSYSPGGFPAIKAEYKWLAEGLKKMEKLTDVLIIDQLSNTGGAVYYGARMLSLFANEKPLNTVKVDYKLNHTMLQALKPEVDKEPIDGTDATFADMHLQKKYYKELTARFEGGQRRSGLIPSFDLLSKNFENSAGEVFAAIEGAYSKPILLLNDRMSGSGGDFFPAQMQANGRAKIMGETSCGLGGPVYRKVDSMAGSEMGFRCTFAYAELPNGWPIENIGAVPDIYRPIVMSDLGDGFKTFATEALDEAAKLAGWKAEKTEPKKTDKPGANVAKIKAITDLMKNPSSSPATYVKNVKRLIEINAEVTPADWSGIVIPLPASLKEDLMLRTIYQRLEVLYRLKEMKELKQWQSQPAQLAMIDSLIELAEKLPADARFNDPCELRLTMGPLK